MMREHPEAYSAKANVQLQRRDGCAIRSPRRRGRFCSCCSPPPAVVFVIACSNVANLILARSVRREGELAVRAALGAGRGALRRTLLAESLVLCGAGAVLGVLLARPLVAVVARYAARFSVRALDVTVDAQRALGRRRPGDGRGRAARLRAAPAVAARAGRSRPGERQHPHHAGHQPPAAGVRDDADRVLVRAARRRGHAARDARRAADARTPATTCGRCWRSTCRHRRPASGRRREVIDFYQEATRRDRRSCPAWSGVAVGQLRAVARRRQLRPGGPVHGRGLHAGGRRREPARAVPQSSRLGFFAVLGVPIVAGRDFTDEDRAASERVVIVSQSVAQRLFPNGDALNRHMWWTDPYFGKPVPRRIVGIVADVDDENVVRRPALAIYHAGPADGRGRPPVRARGRRSVRARAGGHARHPRDVARTSRWSAPRRSRTCARKCSSPERLNAFVLSGFAGIALLIAVVGVAGVLAFSVSARTREFGVRLADRIGAAATARARARRKAW